MRFTRLFLWFDISIIHIWLDQISIRFRQHFWNNFIIKQTTVNLLLGCLLSISSIYSIRQKGEEQEEEEHEQWEEEKKEKNKNKNKGTIALVGVNDETMYLRCIYLPVIK